MKLIGNLKKKVENAQTKEEARDAIKKAGMFLDDDELEAVSGGGGGGDSDQSRLVRFNSDCIYNGTNYGDHKWEDCKVFFRCKRCQCWCRDRRMNGFDYNFYAPD